MTRDFDETFIEAKIVTYRVLPALFVGLVVRKIFHDKFVNSI